MPAALLVLDLINDIVHPDGKIAASAGEVAARGTIAAANAAVARARADGILPIFVKVGFPAGYANCPATSPMFAAARTHGALRLGDWGTDFHADLDVRPDDPVVVKSRVGPFHATPLETFLFANRIDTLLVAGVSTVWAVESAVREGHDRDLQVAVVEDACAAGTRGEHDEAVARLSRIARITTAAVL